MKKPKISKQALMETIVTKLNRPGKDGLIYTAGDMAKDTGWTQTYISWLASTLRVNFHIPGKWKNLDSHIDLIKKNHPELLKK